MRGLAFPPNAVFEREPSHEYGTPFPGGDQIPIDPALGGLAIDPAIMGESSTGVGRVNSFEHVPIEPPAPFPENYPAPRQISQEPPQYSQGPQGDPFAPQPSYTPMVEQPPPPNPPKKKRRPRREEECGFCEGNDQKNKAGEPELMVTCDDCGRSGHPSCMELSEIGHVMHSYAWKCADCKSCEVCHEKGDEERILFCDFCDRGWHMDCLPDPLEEQPPGRWHCPMCPPVDQHQMLYPFTEPMPGDPEPLPPELDSSQSPNYFAKGKGKHGGDEEDAVDDEIPFQLKTRNRPKSNKKAKVPKNSRVGERIVSPARPPKRMRFRFNERASLPRIRLRLPALGKGKAREDDEEHRKGIFDDILSVEERDTSKSAVEFADKQRFEKSRLAAEIKLAPPPTPVPHADEGHDPSTPGPSTRPLRSSTIQSLPIAIPTPAPSSPAPSTPGPLTKTGPSSQPPLRIRTIRFGPHDIQTWYDAPFPEEYASIPDGRMWICEFCLKYMKSRFGAGRHRMKCKARHPPGDEIYRDGAVSIFEVDGRKNKIYCQNLCLLSKMFLDHKSLFYDVEPFLFYVMTETDDNGAHFIGYFSKEKRSPKDYNVSCIMTLPNRQRKGWGNLLIDFSYLLSKKEQRLGSPEKPLSGLGAVGYKNYWTLSLMRYLDLAPDHPKLADVSTATSMTLEDACTTLSQQGMISIRDTTPPIVRPSPGQSIKYPKGRKNGIARRHLQRVPTQDDENAATPFVVPKHYEICWSREKVTSYLTAWESKGYPKLKPEKLKWSPFLTSQIKTSEILEATEASSSVSDPLHRLPTTGLSTPKDVSTSLRGDEDGASTFTDVLPVWSTHPDNDKHAKESSSPVKVVRTEEDRLFAQELAESPSFPRRQLRSQSTRSSSVSSSTRANAARAENVTPLLNRLRRSESVRTPNMEYDAADTVIDDEAFAAKLELEERRSTRRLRSRTEVQSVDSRISSTPNSRHTSPRKRRRVDSSPEIDTPLKPVNGKRDNIPNPLTPRKSNRLANGSPPNCKPDVTMEPVAAESVVPSGNDVAMSELVETEETYKTGDAWEKSQEVKCEDIGTPLTSVTSLPHDELPTPADTNSLPVSNNFEKEQQSGPAIPDALEAEEADVYGEFDEDAEGEPDEDLLEVQ